MTPAEQLEAAAPDVRKNILYLIHNHEDESDEMYKPGNTVAFAKKVRIPRDTLVRLLDERPSPDPVATLLVERSSAKRGAPRFICRFARAGQTAS
jgi:hypothetical protein